MYLYFFFFLYFYTQLNEHWCVYIELRIHDGYQHTTVAAVATRHFNSTECIICIVLKGMKGW